MSPTPETAPKQPEHTLRTALIQHQYAGADNRQALESAIENAATSGAKLVILPELHETPYFCQIEHSQRFDLAEVIPGPTSAWLSSMAKRHSCVIVGSLFEKRAAGLYHNTAVVMDSDGSLAGCFRKMHIPDDPGYYEKFYFTPGDVDATKNFRPISTSVGNLGVLVCWDQWYPEAARLMALAGADLLIYPTAIGYTPEEPADEQQRQRDAWQLVQRGHAVANGLPVLACNRSGFEGEGAGHGHNRDDSGLKFWGSSFACGAQGEMLAVLDESSGILIADIDLRRTEEVRRMWPFLRDRQPQAYAEITSRFRD